MVNNIISDTLREQFHYVAYNEIAQQVHFNCNERLHSQTGNDLLFKNLFNSLFNVSPLSSMSTFTLVYGESK